MSVTFLFLALSDVLSSVVAAKSDAIQQDPFATTAFDGPTNASMTWYPNEGVPTSVPALVNVPVKSGPQTVLLLHPRSESEPQVKD